MTGGSMKIARIGDTYINLNRMNFIQDYDRSDCYDMCIRGQSQRVRVEVG